MTSWETILFCFCLSFLVLLFSVILFCRLAGVGFNPLILSLGF